MRTPTYSRAQWFEAQNSWVSGGFSDEWNEWRSLAASGPGIIYPPDGSALDSWDDDSPSQRAILIRAIRETPELLRWAIKGTKRPSWSLVIGRLLEGRDELREDRNIDMARVEREQEALPSAREAMYSLKNIIDILGDS